MDEGVASTLHTGSPPPSCEVQTEGNLRSNVGRTGDRSRLWFGHRCSRDLPYGINDCLWAVNLNVVAASPRHIESGLIGERIASCSGAIALGGLPCLEKWSMIRRNNCERDIWKRTPVHDLPVAFGNPFLGRRSRFEARTCSTRSGHWGSKRPARQHLTSRWGIFSQTFAETTANCAGLDN
jgi:hypothetical protein